MKDIEIRDVLEDIRSWTPHGSFPGVFTEKVIAGETTDGSATCLLVKIDANMEIGKHVHEDNTEIHYVLEGTGTCVLEGTEIPYSPGVLAVMPKGRLHSVSSEKGLKLLAIFTPCL